LATGILLRIPVNIIDRFIIVFGGYFIALGLLKAERAAPKTAPSET